MQNLFRSCKFSIEIRPQLGLLSLPLPALSRNREGSGFIDNFPRLIAHALAGLNFGNRITMARPGELHSEAPPGAPVDEASSFLHSLIKPRPGAHDAPGIDS